MKSVFIFVLILLAYSVSFAESEKPEYKRISNKFVNFFNQKSADSLFNLFSGEMKNALPIDKTTEFVNGLYGQVGKIEKIEFEKYQSTYAIYKTKFEKETFSLNISLDGESKINGLLIKPYAPDTNPKMERTTTKMRLPFDGVWTVIWGGDTKDLNYHVDYESQKNAFDFVITDESGRSFKNEGKTNDDFYAFGKPLFAPCAGEVVLAVNGVKDNAPGVMNPFFPSGNTIILKTENNEYILLAHFKQNTIKVKQGDKVAKGQELGLCGNSGNSTEAHLHFHVQNIEDVNSAIGVKCYFEKIMVNGIEKFDYSPIQKEKIQAVK